MIVTGRLRVRDWATDDKRGTNVEIDADAVGHDLSWGTTVFTRSTAAAVAEAEDAARRRRRRDDADGGTDDDDDDADAEPRRRRTGRLGSAVLESSRPGCSAGGRGDRHAGHRGTAAGSSSPWRSRPLSASGLTACVGGPPMPTPTRTVTPTPGETDAARAGDRPQRHGDREPAVLRSGEHRHDRERRRDRRPLLHRRAGRGRVLERGDGGHARPHDRSTPRPTTSSSRCGSTAPAWSGSTAAPATRATPGRCSPTAAA